MKNQERLLMVLKDESGDYKVFDEGNVATMLRKVNGKWTGLGLEDERAEWIGERIERLEKASI